VSVRTSGWTRRGDPIAALLVLAALVAGVAPARAGSDAPLPAADSLARRGVLLLAPASGFTLPVERITFGTAETESCLRCHGMPQFMLRDSLTGALLQLTVARGMFANSAHRGLSCSNCHRDVRAYPHELKRPRPPVGCDADCHAVDARGRPIRHQDQPGELAHSAHGAKLPVPLVCIDCHGQGDAHAVERGPGTAPPAARLAMCAPCHEDRRRMARAGHGVEAASSYAIGPHARAIRSGAVKAATCESCHDAHGVRAASDTASAASPAKLVATCGRKDCHLGAGTRFAMSGTDHLSLTVAERPGLGALERVSRLLGWGLAALMALAALLDAQRRFLRVPRVTPESVQPLVQRLSLAMRVQHGVLVLAFTTLVLTGLPLRFPDSGLLAALVRLIGGWGVARVAHRAAAHALGLLAVAHLAYAFVVLMRARFEVRRAWPMLPGVRAVREGWEGTLHALRLRREPPDYGRHQPREQLHYLTVAWGVPAMVLTGLALWIPARLAEHMPPLAVTAAAMLHRDEALIAVAVVLVWHLYHVHVSPGAHHRFMTWLDGRVTRGYRAREHPAETRERRK